MILGFMLGCVVTTWYWAWIASLYDKPLPPPTGAVRLEDNGTPTYIDRMPRFGTQWKRDRGP